MAGSRDRASLLRLIGTGVVHETSEVRNCKRTNTRVSIGSNENKISDAYLAASDDRRRSVLVMGSFTRGAGRRSLHRLVRRWVCLEIVAIHRRYASEMLIEVTQ